MKFPQEKSVNDFVEPKHPLSHWEFTEADRLDINIIEWHIEDREKIDSIIKFMNIIRDVSFRSHYLISDLEFNSTISKLPPKTIAERLQTFVNDSQQIIEFLTTQNYTDAVWKLDSLNESISKLVLSQIFPIGTKQALDNLSESLALCHRIIYKTLLEEGNPEEIVRSKNVIAFMQGVKNVLNAYANTEEWQTRMTRDLGE